MSMKIFVILILSTLSLAVHSNECDSKKKSVLIDRLKAKNLGDANANGKLSKLIDHDYPLGCEIYHNGHVFTWYTDSQGKRYIIKFESSGENKKVEHFGVFKQNI